MKRIIVDAAGDMARTAIVENGKLLEVLIDPAGSRSVAGNIYAGIVKAVLPNQFVFIDIGLEKNAFLNFSDRKENRAFPRLKPGQEVLVQAVKDPSGLKGARVTAEISLSGRYAVYLKKSLASGISVSKKITSKTERRRLKKIAHDKIPSGYSAIIRTEAADIEAEIITNELGRLGAMMETVEREGRYKKAPAVVFGEGPVANKQVCDIFNKDVEKIIINSRADAENLKKTPGMVPDRIEIYSGDEDIFERYHINTAIDGALERKVWLKSGGFLIIDQTESCFVIDVNTGKYTGKAGHGKSMLKTDLEAAEEIAYQIRLRNLSGMIIIDFIDIKNKRDKALVKDCLQKALLNDRIPANILDSSVLGLFILTRKRVREPLMNIVGGTCPQCGAWRR